MLSSNELSDLFKIISDENQTFESISKLFSGTFKKCDNLKIATSLCILIKDNLLNLHQRIISFYLLYIMNKNDQLEIAPFLPLIIETIKITRNRTEQNFLFDFLYNKINYLNTTVKQYIQDSTKIVKINIPQIQMLYDKYYMELNKSGYNKSKNDYIRHVIYDRKKTDITNVDNHSNIDLSKSINVEDELSLKYSVPNFMSFCPMNLNTKNNNSRIERNIFDREPIWLMPGLKHNFVWDNKKDQNNGAKEEK